MKKLKTNANNKRNEKTTSSALRPLAKSEVATAAAGTLETSLSREVSVLSRDSIKEKMDIPAHIQANLQELEVLVSETSREDEFIKRLESDLKKMREASSDNNQSRQNAIAELKLNIRNIHSQLEKIKRQAITLQAVSDRKPLEDELAKHTRVIKEESDKEKDANAKTKTLESEVREQTREKNDLKAKKDAVLNDVKNTMVEKNRIQEQLKRTLAERDEFQNLIDKLKLSIEKRAFDISDLRANLESIKAENEAKIIAKQSLERQLWNLKAEFEKQQKNSDANRETENASKVAYEAEKLRKAVLHNEIERATKEVNELEANNSSEKKQQNDLNDIRERQKREVTELEDQVRSTEASEKVLDNELQSIIKNIQKTSVEIDTVKDFTRDALAEISITNTDKEKSKARNRELQAEIKQITEIIQNLTSVRDKYKANLAAENANRQLSPSPQLAKSSADSASQTNQSATATEAYIAPIVHSAAAPAQQVPSLPQASALQPQPSLNQQPIAASYLLPNPAYTPSLNTNQPGTFNIPSMMLPTQTVTGEIVQEQYFLCSDNCWYPASAWNNVGPKR